MPQTSYDSDFFDRTKPGTRRSAEALVPIVLELVSPRSVVDVGCGEGVWLKVFHEHGVVDLLGIDGDYIDEARLEVAPQQFKAADLTTPLELGRRFDLAVSLEVGEHLPDSAAATYVESLARLAPAIVFSAAIPHQAGVDHVNGQWPGYWADHFERHGYKCIDCFRSRLWERDEIQPWYAQNTLLFASPELLDSNDALRGENDRAGGRPLALIHPRVRRLPNPRHCLKRLQRLGVMTEEEVRAKEDAVADWERRQSGFA